MKNSLKAIPVLTSLIIVIVACLVIIISNDPSKGKDDDPNEENTTSSAVDDMQESGNSSGSEDQMTTADSIDDEQSTEEADDWQRADEDPGSSDVNPKVQNFLASVKNVYEMAYYGNYASGNSLSTPPCADGLISGDRLVARALWDLGYVDQPLGGITDLISYLPAHGFEVITDKSQLKAGDIVQVTVYDRADGVPWIATFVLVSYDPVTERCEKYDLTEFTVDGKSRLKSVQPFDTLLEENGNMRVFKYAFRMK